MKRRNFRLLETGLSIPSSPGICCRSSPREKKTRDLVPETMTGGRKLYLEFEYSLFVDEQAAIPGGFCGICGCECYAPGLHCLRCERRLP